MMTAQDLNQVMLLTELLHGFGVEDLPQTRLSGIAIDSRLVKPGDLFVARAGTNEHGIRYIPQAIAAGAVAVLIDSGSSLDLPKISVPVLAIPQLNEQLGYIADRFYGEPSRHLQVVGITGTNGKTSVAWFLTHAFSAELGKAGMVGTLGIGFPSRLQKTANTTPDPVTVHHLLAEFQACGAERVLMEVSSHALDQHRVTGVRFNTAILTNVSREHLDYHGSMQAYADAKRRLFIEYGVEHRVLNLDDPFGVQLADEFAGDTTAYGYSINESCPYQGDRLIKGRRINNQQGLISLQIDSPWGKAELRSHLLGDFNIHNLLACVTTLCLHGLSLDEAVARLEQCPGVPGRMEPFGGSGKPLVVVDYAHTPDALEKVLRSLREFCRGRLVCVFGCGGERDTGKRSQMGQIVSQLADEIVITNDNPRNEDPEAIVNDILVGIQDKQRSSIELDRSEAITLAIRQARPDDIILVAGKGHETIQEIAGQCMPFSDRQLVRCCIEVWS